MTSQNQNKINLYITLVLRHAESMDPSQQLKLVHKICKKISKSTIQLPGYIAIKVNIKPIIKHHYKANSRTPSQQYQHVRTQSRHISHCSQGRI